MKYTDEQRKLIEQNPNVVRCGVTGITFKGEFKVEAVKQYDQGKLPREIFKDAGFEVNLIGKDISSDRLVAWRKIFQRSGVQELLNNKTGKHKNGGRTKIKGLTEKEKIRYLEAQVEYLKAENDFLAKLRAKKRAE